MLFVTVCFKEYPDFPVGTFNRITFWVVHCSVDTLDFQFLYFSGPFFVTFFGGLWEAAVRSAKRLLIRTMGTHVLTYEEFTTLLTRVEAVLNSRPLTPLTTDPADLDYLSPGHFLIGQPLLAVPPRVSFESRINLTQLWKLLDQYHQSFWRRWSTEYLTSLQGRSKWTIEAPNVRVNDMVVIIDNQSLPLTWRLGRILEVLPGNDGVVRVVRLLTRQGEITRPITKIIVLPAQ